MQLDTFEYAPVWIKKFFEAQTGGRKFTAVNLIRVYDADAKKYPTLRDRTGDARRALMGFGNVLGDIVEVEATGAEMYEYGFEAAGAQHVQKFKLLFKL